VVGIYFIRLGVTAMRKLFNAVEDIFMCVRTDSSEIFFIYDNNLAIESIFFWPAVGKIILNLLCPNCVHSYVH
jgi:hypothetical protein